jgi:hypothetical protein
MNHFNNHYTVMFFIMLLSGALSTMNVWADSLDHIYFSLNDVYMIFLMTGWMFLFMGIYYGDSKVGSLGFVLTILSFFAIRTQAFVTENQFLRGMIPHHSMAVFMSKKLQEKQNRIPEFLEGIVSTQEDEISFMEKRI